MNEEWINDLRGRMDAYEEPAPEGLWESISSASDGEHEFPVSGRRSRMNPLLGYGLAGSAAAAVAIFLLSGLLDRGSVQDDFAVVCPERYASVLSDVPDVHAIHPGRIPDCVPLADFYRDIPSDDAFLPGDSESGADDVAADKDTVVENVSVAAGKEKDIPDVQDRREDIPVPGPYPESWPFDNSGHTGGKSRVRRWSAGIVASNVPSSVSSSSTGFDDAMFAPVSGPAAGSLSDIRTFNTTRETNTSSTHFQPLRVGVSVRYMITDRWSVESGVTYAWLRSKSRSGSDDYYYSGFQSLHYVGLPLNIGFNVWGSRYLTVYASAGGLMEKCVGGELRTVSYFKGSKGDTVREDVMVKPVQWSVSASLGLQYNISSLVGLYLEPGIMYSFDNGSSVSTVYSARPFNFNIGLGLRFMF